VPYSQNFISLGQMIFELRVAGNPLSLSRAVRQVVQQADARVLAYNIGTQANRIDQTISQERTLATLCVCFAVLALLIACVGLYGTMAYSVARRTGEIGIRMALGAQRRRLIWMVLQEVLAMALVGLGIGLAVSVATSHALESFMFQVKPNDPFALALAALVLFATALLAG
jgi:macrolide transport system ATP-binding/permease protein